MDFCCSSFQSLLHKKRKKALPLALLNMKAFIFSICLLRNEEKKTPNIMALDPALSLNSNNTTIPKSNHFSFHISLFFLAFQFSVFDRIQLEKFENALIFLKEFFSFYFEMACLQCECRISEYVAEN